MLEQYVKKILTSRVYDVAVETPLQRIRISVLTALNKTATDEQARRVFLIATQQVEFNGEMLAVRERKLAWRDEYLRYLTEEFQTAAADAGFALPVPARVAALGLKAVLTGMLDNWLLDVQLASGSTLRISQHPSGS